MPGKPPVGTKGIGGSMPRARLGDINSDTILRASYQGECVTLSPAMTLQEFRAELGQLYIAIDGIATARAEREATASAERSPAVQSTE